MKMSKVDSLKELGNSYFKNKDFLKAIQCYKEGLEINPANWVLNNNIAQAYLANRNYSEAETHAVVTVALQESSVKGYYRAAKAACNLNKPDRALTYVRKGLSVCPSSEELRALLDQLRKVKPDLANGFPEKTNEKASGSKKEGKDKGSKKDRSRSISNTRMASSSPSPSSSADINDKRSTSSSRSDKAENEPKSKKKGKANRGPIEIEDIQNDKVLKTVEGLLDEQRTSRVEDSFETVRKNLWSYMKDGSEALEKGLSRKASEKYKSAVDTIVTHNFVVFGMKEIDYVILRYSLSISYIETASYNDIIKSLEYLGDIEEKHSAKLPAVYYALGNAYCKLNRFRVALEHLDKGSKVIEKGFKITTHPWPGTMTIIKETTKSGLQESLETLINYCKTYREPDAICRYKKCLEISPHIIPSEFIFYSDPDYVGYVVVICEEDCKITYHIHCWRNFKECLSPVAKLADKEMLGRRCLTSDCVNEANEPSVIVKIEIYGDDGNIKSTCSKDPNRVNNNNNNTKENKKEKKKRNDKTVENIPNVKTKAKRKKERKTNSESSTVTIKDVPVTNTSDRVKRLQKLEALRKINFGFAPETTFLPDAEYFGRSDLASLESFLTPEYVGETPELKNKKEFVFTYFFEYINSEGPQKIKDIEEKWKEEVSQFHGVTEFMSENEGICNFLLQSYRFAALDDYLCVASQLPETYNQVKSELSEGLLFKLGSKSSIVPPAAENLPVTNNLGGLAPIEEEVASNNSQMSPVPAEPSLDNDVEEKEPDEDFVAKVHNEMYFSDADNSSDSESDEYVEDEEEEVEEEDDDELVDAKSDISSIAGLNPNAQEFMPPTVKVEKFYDDLVEQGYDSSGDRKEKFVEYVSNYFHTNAPDQTESRPDADNRSVQTDATPDPEPSQPAPPPPPEVFENCTQTEPGRNFEEEIEKLSADVKKLHLSLTAQAKQSETVRENFERESEKFKETVKAYDAKIVALENDRIKEIKNLQLEISKKDSKMDVMKKKYCDQIDKLNKKVEEDGAAFKEMETKVKELTQTVASLTTKLEDEQKRGKESQKAMLDAKNAFGTSLISVYRENCADKLRRMKAMEKYLNETGTPTLSEMKEAIKQWEGVQKQAEMISAQFEIKYAAMSEQLEKTGRLTEALEFAASDLPKEPACPLDDMESIIHKALEKRKSASPPNPGAGGDASLLQNSHVNTVTSDARTSPHPHCSFLSSSPYSHQAQGQNLYMAANSMPYRSGTYQTSAFGVAPPFAVRMPPAVLPTPIAKPVPLTGFLANGPLFLEQNGKFSSMDKSKNVDATEGFKPFSFEAKTTVDQLKRPGFAAGMSKLEPFGSKPETSSTAKSIPVSTASKLPEKRKLSSVAGLTPIETKTVPVETKKPAAVAPAVTIPKAVHKPQSALNSEVKSHSTSSQKMWRYQKLLNALKDSFRTEDENVLADCLAIARERNNNTLSGLTIPVIYEMVAKVLKERSEKNQNGQMAMDKFGGCPWGGVKESHYDWNKPAEDLEECIICHIQMTSDVTPLQCKHTFHTECIRKWLKTNSTCPMCRKYTTMNDEFPPLA